MPRRLLPTLALVSGLAAGCSSVSLPPRPSSERDRSTVLDVAARLSAPRPQRAAPPARSQRAPSAPRSAPAPAAAPRPGAPPPVRRAPPPPGATAYATSSSGDHTMRTPSIVVAVTREGRMSAEGRYLDAKSLEARLRALARERPDAVVIVRPVPGAPDWRVRDVAAACDRVGLHCLPFPAH